VEERFVITAKPDGKNIKPYSIEVIGRDYLQGFEEKLDLSNSDLADLSKALGNYTVSALTKLLRSVVFQLQSHLRTEGLAEMQARNTARDEVDKALTDFYRTSYQDENE
jgi:hypothetical protein